MPPIECVLAVAQALQQLSHRVDRIRGNAQAQAAIREVAAALLALQGSIARTASSDAVARLSEEVRSLASKVDDSARRIGGALAAVIEPQLAFFAEALDARNRSGRRPASELDALLRTLIDKFEHGGLARYDESTLERLERLVAKLIAKLAAADGGLPEASEPGSTEPRLDRHDFSNVAATAATAPTIDALARDVAELRQAEKRSQDSLEAVHGTIGHMVHRLAMIEADMRASSAPPTPPAPVMGGTAADAAASPEACRPASSSPVMTVSVDGNLSPDAAADLEDSPPKPPRGRGSGGPSGGGSGADASPRAILPCVPSDSGGKSDFIAAARRAVQAASRQAREDHTVAPAGARRSATLVRVGMVAALVGALAVALALVGGLQIADGLRTAPGDAKSDAPVTAAAASGLVAEGAAPAGEAPPADRTGSLHAPEGTTGAAIGMLISGATEPPAQAPNELPPPARR
jgi:localization factor PodJL